ncbi:hypothetical protein V3C99_018270 [Haemonchus contortus]
MAFKGAVRLSLALQQEPSRRVVFFVRRGNDNTIVLGTNVLRTTGLQALLKPAAEMKRNSVSVQTLSSDSEKRASATQTAPLPKSKPRKSPSKSFPCERVEVKKLVEKEVAKPVSATIAARVYLKPGETKHVPISGIPSKSTQVLWSDCDLIPNAVCKSGQTLSIPVTNTTDEAKVFQAGEKIGCWDQRVIIEKSPMHCANMLERTSAPMSDRWKVLVGLLQQNKSEGSWCELLENNVRDFQDVFAVTDQELTQTHLVEHDIQTGSAKPIKQKARPVPLAARAELRKILMDLQDRNIIEPSSSPWSSPIVLVRKKDGSLRLCVDYRKVNQVTHIDSHPLPTIDTILQNLKGKSWFSTLDLSSGYWQMMLANGAKEKSAFATTEGLYQFKVLPFGLASSPAAFQRLMHSVLHSLQGDEVSCYLDDIIVATATKGRHMVVLGKVLERLRSANLKLNPKKCILMEPKVEFLGHVLDRDGLHADPKKISAIREYPTPQTRSELKTFLGMCSYYRKFILRFSKIAAPLHEMTSEGTKFEWTKSRTDAFETLKEALTSTPVLAQPDIEGARSGARPFCIHTDASYSGVGAVLSQKGDDNFLHPIFFASK